jgi:GNAT superfamily N-acetyltransferase
VTGGAAGAGRLHEPGGTSGAAGIPWRRGGGAWQGEPVTKLAVRAATEDDLAAIAAVAAATGQVEEWSGSDPAYVRHLLAHGKVMVAERRGAGERGTVTGFGATRRIGRGPAAVTMLCDLFVDPGSHGRGAGRALLAALWEPGSPRMTFSSLHAHALPLYTRAGLDAWWPLLYLGGDVGALSRAPGWTVAAASPEEVAAREAEWTGIDRSADHQAWAARPGGQPVTARRGAAVLAAGTVAGEDAEYGIAHLAISPAAGDGDAVDAVLAVLASLDPAGGRARVCLPAPHPATRPLLAAGWHVDFMDVFMATEPGLLDPRRAVPSPATA